MSNYESFAEDSQVSWANIEAVISLLWNSITMVSERIKIENVQRYYSIKRGKGCHNWLQSSARLKGAVTYGTHLFR